MKHLKIHSLFSILSGLIILLTGCQKKPSASFSTNKDTYTLGETVMCTDKSGDAYSINWIVRGPTEFRSTTSFFTFSPRLEGNYEITQACYSKNTKKVSKTSKNIVVVNNNSSTSGQYIFYSSDIYNSYVQIYVDGLYKGNITQEYSSAPSCGANGCITLALDPGSHSVQAVFMAFNQSSYYTISVGQGNCNPFFVYY
jgi:hypothetical protein